MAIQIPYTDGFIHEPSASNAESKANKGAPNGYAPLDGNAKVPSANLPVVDVSGQISTHNSDTTSVHGIADTANLVLTNDARLADTRDPKAHNHGISDVTGLQTALDGKQASGSYAPATGIAPSAITGTAVVTNDSRLSDSRTPTAHTHTMSDVTSLQATLTAFAIALG